MPEPNPYSLLDRLLHNLAFRRTGLCELLADVETVLLAHTWSKAGSERPVFITSLPRSGTTVLLEALHRLPGMASHTYRDMPFVLTPVLWDRLSTPFRRRGRSRERAHGDGMQVDFDSPEALEEVLWYRFYSQKYNERGISIWHGEESDPAFRRYFLEHMKKIVRLRQPERMADSRYVSKNNGNIARIKALGAMFPDASIVVPFREPLEHAISLWRQHHNFSRQHAKDPFVRRYMADIGHYEFGMLHRPILFPNLHELTDGLDPRSLDYWLGYWVAAFTHLAQQPGIHFVKYESLCSSGQRGVARLCQELDIPADRPAIERAAKTFRAPPQSRRHHCTVSRRLASDAELIHARLIDRCLLGSSPAVVPID